jgi:deoxyribodipyrimidine photo-lyase
LTDYDPALNNGNWQWAASTGCDAQPYFRIFNPWLQQKKFDVDATYIKTWIPELAHAPAKAIHQHERKPATFDYPTPLIDHKTASTVAKSLFASS